MARGQRWKLVHDPNFESNRKVRKKELEKIIREHEDAFFAAIEQLAEQSCWPFTSGKQLRNGGDESLEVTRIPEHDHMSCLPPSFHV